MADSFSVDFSELDRLAADIGEVTVNAGPYINSAVQVTSGKVKDAARKTVADGNKRWKSLPRAIGYDVKVLNAFGASVIQSEIGYDKDKPSGRLGNVREFGNSKVAPHNDLVNALHENEDDFQKGLEAALVDAERVLNGGNSVGSALSAVIRGRL